MFCPKCGKTVRDGAKFCNHCGANLEQEDFYDDEEDDFDEEPGGKKQKYWLVPLIMFLILAAGFAAAFIVLRILPTQASIFPWAQETQTRETTEEETDQIETEEAEQGAVVRQKFGHAKEETEETFVVDTTAAIEPDEWETTAVAESEELLEELPEEMPEGEDWEADTSADYVLPDSSSRYLTEADLAGLSKEELRLARNEIYARHGRIFTSEELGGYFSSKSWYRGTVSAADFSDDLLSQVEKDNVKLIQQMEEKRS